MTYQERPGRAKKYIVVVIAVVIFAIIFGFALDAVITLIEKKVIYRKPEEYAKYVEKYGEKYGVPEHVIYAVIKAESGFDPDAQSVDDARGLMQMLPSTFNDLSVNHFGEVNDPSDLYTPETNIKYGTYYMSYLYERYGDWTAVYAAYNGGLRNVDGWLEDSEYSTDGRLTSIPFPETEKYVKKVKKYVGEYDRIYKKD